MSHGTLPLLLALLLLPGLADAATVGFSLHLDAPRVEGPAEVASSHAVLDLKPAVLANEALALRWQAARGYLVTNHWTMLGPADDTGFYHPYPAAADNETLRMGPGTLANLTCGQGCRAILYVEDAAGALGMSGHASGSFRWLEEGRKWNSGAHTADWPDTFLLEAPPGRLVASGSGHENATRFAEARAWASGRVSLFLANATAEVREGERVALLDTVQRHQIDQAMGIRTARTTHIPFAVLHLWGASLETPQGTRAELLADAPRLSWSGTMDAAAAWGRIDVDGQRLDARGEDLRLAGTASGSVSLAPPDALPLPATAAPDASVQAQGEGNMTHVQLGTARVVHEAPPALALASGLTVAALVLLVWLAIQGGGLTALYMRVDATRVLQNPNRIRILGALREEAGFSVADLVRTTGIPQVVVRHHLRMLLAHRLVSVQTSGRRKVYFLQGQGRVAPLRYALKTDARRAVAEAIAAAPRGLSQREIVELAGLKQRLVSYHVRILQKEGLVEARGAMPKKYLASERLSDYLARQDGHA